MRKGHMEDIELDEKHIKVSLNKTMVTV